MLDDKTGDGTKEFLTIQTKNGNTFFLVLDRSSNTENVYMLSMVDENDLAEFLDETKTEEAPQVVIPETEVPAESETESETGSEPVQPEEEGGRNTGALLAAGVLATGAIGAGYYFKVVKPKKEESQEDGEDLEFYDGGTYVNEDQPEEDGSTEEENNKEKGAARELAALSHTGESRKGVSDVFGFRGETQRGPGLCESIRG